MNDRLRLYLIKNTIRKQLKSITLKKFLKLDDPVKNELFCLFRYLIKGR